jgi:hypothetical protein
MFKTFVYLLSGHASYFHRHDIQHITHSISKTYRLRPQVKNGGLWWNAVSNLGFTPLFEAI